MTVPAAQSEAAELLRRLTGAAPIETHISAVYVGRDAAYKLKKAVALTFLDFTAIPARERYLRREYAINARHAPGLYRAVHRLTRGPDGALRIGGEGPAEEWVLEMAPLRSDSFLAGMALRRGLDPAMLDALGDAVAAMHAALPPIPGWDAPAAMARVIEGNRRAALAAKLPEDRVEAWTRAAQAALARLAPALSARAAEGHVRRCHGDLHLGNFCLWRGRPTPFDALEFDEELATIDTGYDLAFLLIDLELKLDRAAANGVLNRYVARSGDVGLVAGLPLWLSLRAIIRAHVESARGRDPSRHLAAAEATLMPPAPRVVAIGGLQGTGKTRLARALAPETGPAPGALILRSDELRKRRFGRAPEEALPEEAYAETVSRAVLADLFGAAEVAARDGHAVVADATFLDPADRAGIEAAARAAGLTFTGLWLEAPLEILKARIAARRGDASDATPAVVEAAAARDAGAIDWLRLDASADPEPAARAALARTAPSSC